MPKLEKFANPWAQDGGTVEPTLTTAKRDVGFVGGDIPPVERFNQIIGENQLAINTIIEEGPGSWYPRAADIGAMVTTGLWDESWGITSDTANTINGGATKEYRDLAVYFTSDGDPRLLVMDESLSKIEVWDPRTLLLVDTSDDLTVDLPAAGAVWTCESMCTDGTSVYGTFRDTNASPDVHRIQAWAISDWAVKSGWAATGTALLGTGNAPIIASRQSKVINANAASLAVANTWIAIAAAASTAISIVSKADGTITASGAGDAPTAVTAYALASLCSDETNIFFAVWDDASPFTLYTASATIADPTAGSGGTGFPFDMVDTNTNYAHIISCGQDVVVASADLASPVAADTVVVVSNATTAGLDTFQIGLDAKASPIIGEDWFLSAANDMCFDGFNCWIYGRIRPAGISGNHLLTLTKLDVSKLFLSPSSTEDRQLPDVASGPFVIGPEIEYASHNYYRRCIFDGRDIWAIPQPAASVAGSGQLYRLPMAAMRT